MNMKNANWNRRICSSLLLTVALASLASIMPNAAIASDERVVNSLITKTLDDAPKVKYPRDDRYETVQCSLCGARFEAKREDAFDFDALRGSGHRGLDSPKDRRNRETKGLCERCASHRHYSPCYPDTWDGLSWCEICSSNHKEYINRRNVRRGEIYDNLMDRFSYHLPESAKNVRNEIH